MINQVLKTLFFKGRTTWFIKQDGSFVPGPELPKTLENIDRHSLTKINSTTSIIIGGALGNTESTITYYFDHPNQVWNKGPNLNTKRIHHVSGLVTDKRTKEKFLVVIGGENQALGPLGSTEILKDNKWIKGT